MWRTDALAGSPERSWYATVPASTENLNPKGAEGSGDARSGRRWETMTQRGGVGAGGEVGEAGDATDMTRGRRSGVGDGTQEDRDHLESYGQIDRAPRRHP